MLSYVAVIFWFVFFSYVIYRIIRSQPEALTTGELLLAFASKVLAGCLYGYVFLHYYNGDDTWLLHADSIKEKQLLLNDPHRFFWALTASDAIATRNNFSETAGLYLTNLEYGLQAKTLGIINFISQENYYVNVVFWNFILFWGHFWLFKLLAQEYPRLRKFYFILIFLFPPAVFWLSGIRSDGLLLLSLALLVLNFRKWLSNYRLVPLLLWLAGFLGVLIFRAPVAALLIPALLSWWLSHRFLKAPVLYFVFVYLLVTILFFLSTVFPPFSMPAMVTQRQSDFFYLKGTSFHLDTLKPNIKSFAYIFPQAAENTFLRPYPWEAKGVLQAASAVEIITCWWLLIMVFFHRASNWKNLLLQPMPLAFLLFGATLYLFIGYTVPFPGAIVRYKTIGELLILAAVLTCYKTQPNSNLKKTNITLLQ